MTWFNYEGWSRLIRMSKAVDEKWWDLVPRTGSGVYRLIALADDNHFIPAALSRICGIDESGTLYIGAAKPSLLNRIGSLVKTHDPAFVGKPHKKLSKRLAQCFPPTKLAMSWKLVDEPWQHEAELLSAYDDVFGELPPRNSQQPPIPVPAVGDA